MSKKRDYKDPKYVRWRQAVFRRDEFKCLVCGPTSEAGRRDLEAHHIKRWHDFPELRFNVDNGISLCKKHHVEITGEEERHEPFFVELVQTQKRRLKMKPDAKGSKLRRRNPRLRF